MCDFYGKLVGKYAVNRPMDPSHGMILPSYRFRVGKSRFFQETARLIRKELPKDRDELCATWSNEKKDPLVVPGI